MPRYSPLDRSHRDLGAKMVAFGGWEMPLNYPSGTLVEHRTCRSGAVAFDVSHLGTVRVTGPDAFERLQRTLTNDLGKIAPGRAQYTHLLDPSDASVVDDIIVWWVDEDDFHVMPNASNTSRVMEAVGGSGLRGPNAVDDVTAARAIVAVQGPEARRWLADVVPAARTVRRFGVEKFKWKGATCLVAGTGYTGEDGVEVAVPAPVATAFWEAVLDAGVLPAGLGARDTLRLEAGLPLHGHELGPGITPLQAGLGWVVAWHKGDFRGRAPLEAERRRGVDRELRGVTVDGRQPPRAGYTVHVADEEIGVVTSGNFSPTLGHGIALAFLPPHSREGHEVTIDARGQPLPAKVAPLPFVTKKR